MIETERLWLKNTFVFALVLLFSLLSSWAQSNIYSGSIYAGGVSHTALYISTFPSPPCRYELWQISWRENTGGLTIMDIYHTNAPGDVVRRSLEVKCGQERFTLASDSLRSQKFKKYDGLPLSKETDVLTDVVTQCVTNRGGRAATNALPTIKAIWGRHSHTDAEVVVVDGDHFAELQRILEQTYGKPDERLKSPTPVGNSKTLTYTSEQIGVVLNLTGNGAQTVLSVIGKQKD